MTGAGPRPVLDQLVERAVRLRPGWRIRAYIPEGFAVCCGTIPPGYARDPEEAVEELIRRHPSVTRLIPARAAARMAHGAQVMRRGFAFIDPVPRRPSLEEQVRGTLFDPTTFPMRPAARRVEQRSLTEERFHHWLDTPGGRAAWTWILAQATRLAVAGADRIGAKALVEECRKALKVTINNSWTALLGRRLIDEDPLLFTDRIECRELGRGRRLRPVPGSRSS